MDQRDQPPTHLAHRIRGRELQRIRQRNLDADPLCIRCKAKGFIRLATQVDHKVALINGGTDDKDDDSNRQNLCDECHVEKTNEDMGRTPRPYIGLDGYPLEDESKDATIQLRAMRQ